MFFWILNILASENYYIFRSPPVIIDRPQGDIILHANPGQDVSYDYVNKDFHTPTKEELMPHLEHGVEVIDTSVKNPTNASVNSGSQGSNQAQASTPSPQSSNSTNQGSSSSPASSSPQQSGVAGGTAAANPGSSSSPASSSPQQNGVAGGTAATNPGSSSSPASSTAQQSDVAGGAAAANPGSNASPSTSNNPSSNTNPTDKNSKSESNKQSDSNKKNGNSANKTADSSVFDHRNYPVLLILLLFM